MTFDFFDMSAFLDAGYRVSIGQEPYVDFFYTAGPVHLYMHALFFRLLGFTKEAVLAHLLAVNTTVLAATWLLALRLRRPLERLAVVAATAVTFYGPTAHPWYDQNAHMWFWLAVVVAERGRPGGALAPLAAGALTALSFLCKANVGLGGAAVLAGYLLLGERPARSIALFAAGAVAGGAAIVGTLESPAGMIYDNFIAYSTAERLADVTKMWFILTHPGPATGLAAATAALILLGGRALVVDRRREVWLAAGLLLQTFFAAFTGSMLVQANIPLVGMAFLYLCRLAEWWDGQGRARLARAVVWSAAAAVLLSSITLVDFPATWRWKGSNLSAEYPLRTAAFRGWNAFRPYGEGVDWAVEYIRREVPEGEIWVFPDATVIYGLAGRPSFPKMPFIFHLGYVPAGRRIEEMREHLFAHPPDWIVLHDQREMSFYRTDLLLEWLDLGSFIEGQYVVAARRGEFSILRRAGERPDGVAGEGRALLEADRRERLGRRDDTAAPDDGLAPVGRPGEGDP